MLRSLLIAAVAVSAADAHADPGVAAHALVVGSNAGGPGRPNVTN